MSSGSFPGGVAPAGMPEARERPSRPLGSRGAELSQGHMGLPDDHVGPYALRRKIGAGVSSDMFLAQSPTIDLATGRNKWVVLKVLRDGSTRNRSQIDRFYAQARFATRFDHPNLVQPLDYGCHEGKFFLCFEYVPGLSLQRMMARNGRLELPVVFQVVCDLLRGLCYLHSSAEQTCAPNGFVHSEISPSNLLIGQDGKARLLGFGACLPVKPGERRGEGAVLYQEETEEAEVPRSQPEGLKERSAVLGGPLESASPFRSNPNYVAPEQTDGGAQQASDIFCAGIILHELLTNQPLSTGDAEQDLAAPHLASEDPAVLQNGPVLNCLRQACLQALSLEPENRPSARELLEQITVSATGEPWASNGTVGPSAVAQLVAASVSQKGHDRVTPPTPLYHARAANDSQRIDDSTTWPRIERLSSMPPTGGQTNVLLDEVISISSTRRRVLQLALVSVLGFGVSFGWFRSTRQDPASQPIEQTRITHAAPPSVLTSTVPAQVSGLAATVAAATTAVPVQSPTIVTNALGAAELSTEAHLEHSDVGEARPAKAEKGSAADSISATLKTSAREARRRRLKRWLVANKPANAIAAPVASKAQLREIPQSKKETQPGGELGSSTRKRTRSIDAENPYGQ